MNIKRIIYTILTLLLFAINSFGQDKGCSYNVKVRGLVFVSQPRLSKTRPNDIKIDRVSRIVFVPFESDSSISPLKYFKEGFSEAFYTFYPYQWEDAFDECADTAIIKNAITELSIQDQLSTSTTYYKVKGTKNKGIYSIYYLEGDWLGMDYDPWSNNLSSSFRLELINPEVRKIKLYYLLNCMRLIECTNLKHKDIKKVK